MSPTRRTAVAAGILYFVTHVTSVAALVLYGGSGTGADWLAAHRGSVLAGAVLEIVLAVAVVGTAVALFPLLRERAPAVASGYLALRTLEASVILAGVVTILPIVAAPASTSLPGLAPDVAQGLALAHDWTFLIGPGLVVPVHTVLLALHLWRSGRAPRFIAALGLVGGPLVGLMNVGVMFGVTGIVPILVVPVFAWEITLAGWLILRGLREPS
ncbi:MAG: DUF4386 domain-containing protein [Actinobacteria bacterium]|jgi:hypothetical protein|nr:DUF4386 domain-containing protein [Actinomycetota bacterium]